MALLEALTYECWIPFKITRFGCVLELIERHHRQVYVCWQTNLLFTYAVKNYVYSTVWGYPLPHRIQHTVQSSTQNLNLHSNANQVKFRLWEFEFTLTWRLLALEEKTVYSALPYQHLLGSSTVSKSNSAYSLFIKMILLLKSSGITSMSYVQTTVTSLASTPCLLYTSPSPRD